MKTSKTLQIENPTYINILQITQADQRSADYGSTIAEAVANQIITHTVTYPTRKLVTHAVHSLEDPNLPILISATIKAGAKVLNTNNGKNLLIDPANRKLYIRVSYSDLNMYCQKGLTVTRNKCRIEFYRDISQHYDDLPRYEPKIWRSR